MFDSGRACRLTIPILCAAFGASLFGATDLSTYRGMQFGMDLAAAAKQSDMKVTDAKAVHERPDLIQEIDWQPRASFAPDPVKVDPVQTRCSPFSTGTSSALSLCTTATRPKA